MGCCLTQEESNIVVAENLNKVKSSKCDRRDWVLPYTHTHTRVCVKELNVQTCFWLRKDQHHFLMTMGGASKGRHRVC